MSGKTGRRRHARDTRGLIGHLGWWGGTLVGWLVLLATGLLLMTLLAAVLDVLLRTMGAVDTVAAAVATSAAAVASTVFLAVVSSRVGRSLAKRGMPARLWMVPAGYAAAIGAALLVSMGVLFFMGAPGPLPWSVETIIGFTVFVASAVAPAAAALAFRAGSRRVRSWAAAEAAAPVAVGQEAP